MTAARGLLRDLVERRLWPIAILLIAAAVAVPVYLGRSSADGPTLPPVNQQADAGKASKAAVSIEDPAADGQRTGSVRNPFKQLHVPKPREADKSGSATLAPAPSTGGSGGDGSLPPTSAGGSTGGAGGSTGGSDGSGDTKPAPKPQTDPLDLLHLTVKVGRADKTLKTLKDVARLSPLPSADDPFMVYTGVLKDGKTAVFLLSSDAEATGDGHCKPSADNCQSAEVKEGDTEFFDLTVNGQPVQYELDVLHVTKTEAAAASERHSVAGAAMVRSAHVNDTSRFTGAAAYRWVPELGVLVRTPKHGTARTSVTGGAGASPAASLPGQPVWHWKLGG
jgi:hypothetical protein